MGQDDSTGPAFADIAGIRTEMREQGKGRPLLFLHPETGLAGADPAIEALARRFRVIAPAHPGFERSELGPGMTSVDDLAYFYLDLVEQMGLREIVLVGASFGGWIAAEIAIKGSERFTALVLAGAVGIRVNRREQRDLPDLFAMNKADQDAALYSAPAFAMPAVDKLSDAEVEIICRNREALALFGWAPYLHDPKLKGRLHRIATPTLLLWGAEDRFAPPAYGRDYAAAIPGARFATLSGAGHFPHLEQPDAFAEAITAFLAEARPAQLSVAAAGR